MSDPKRMIGLPITTGIVIGSMIGSGIFMLPVSLAPLGINAVIGWLMSIAGALSIAFALSRLSKLGSGGMQSYIEQQLGRKIAFVTSWNFWWSNWVSSPAVAVAFGSAISRLSPMLGPPSVIPIAILAIVSLTFINTLGVRASGGFNLATVAIKILPLLGVSLLLLLAFAAGRPLQPLASAPVTLGGIATATSLTLFALTGFENVTAPVGKIRNAEWTLPRAIIGGVATVGLLYLFSSTGILLLLSSAATVSSPAPYADVFDDIGGEMLVRLAALAIAINALGALNCVILATGEVGYSMALRRQLPGSMAKTLGGNTPYTAQIVGSALAILLVIANSNKATTKLFEFAILLATSGILIVYLAGAISSWKITGSNGARILLFVAFLFIAFAIYGAGLEADLWCLVLIASGIAIYTVMRRFNPDSSPSPALVAAGGAPPE